MNKQIRVVLAEDQAMVLGALAALLEIEKEMETLTHQMAETDPKSDEYQKITERYHRIETEFFARLVDLHRAVALGDIVDTRESAGDGKQRGVRGGIDVQWRPRVGGVPGAGAVQPPVAQHDAVDAGRVERGVLQGAHTPR